MFDKNLCCGHLLKSPQRREPFEHHLPTGILTGKQCFTLIEDFPITVSSMSTFPNVWMSGILLSI